MDNNKSKIVVCQACGYSGALDTYKASLSVYSDCRCPKCGSTNNQHNREYFDMIQAAFAKKDEKKS